MSGNGPPPVLYRPIPRRPFALNQAPQAPSEDDENRDGFRRSHAQRQKESADSERLPDTRPAFLDVDPSSTPGGGDSISRAQSILNLTSSTLFGIFSPTSASRGSIAGDPSTPWGAGAETPAGGPLYESRGDGDAGVADAAGAAEVAGTAASAADIDAVRKASQSLMMLQRQQRRRAQSDAPDAALGIKLQPAPAGRGANNRAAEARPIPAPVSGGVPQQRAVVFLSVVGRAALLFALGMGYGVLVARLRSGTHAPFEDIVPSTAPPTTVPGAAVAAVAEYDASYDWRYLVSWGLSGIVLGTLLPWFDSVWDRTFGRSGSVLGKARTAPETDWALVVRGIGAFAGVVFAMRKLPWASTMQASLTLALANPFLWYLLDRSKSGFLLAAVVGFVGSCVLMALDLDLMPNPGTLSGSYPVGFAGGMRGGFDGPSGRQNGSNQAASSSSTAAASGSDFASPASAVTAETAVWMLSVLFCSCVCFGNIGRRLALRPAQAGQSQ